MKFRSSRVFPLCIGQGVCLFFDGFLGPDFQPGLLTAESSTIRREGFPIQGVTPMSLNNPKRRRASPAYG